MDAVCGCFVDAMWTLCECNVDVKNSAEKCVDAVWMVCGWCVDPNSRSKVGEKN